MDSLVAQWDSIQSKVAGVPNYEVSASDDPHQATISLDKQITEFSYEPKEPKVSLASAFSSIEEETNTRSKNRGPRKSAKTVRGGMLRPKNAKRVLEFEGDRKKYKRVGDVFWFREIMNLSSMIFILVIVTSLPMDLEPSITRCIHYRDIAMFRLAVKMQFYHNG